MSRTTVKYTGATPGADSNSYTLYDTTVASPHCRHFFAMCCIARYVVHLTVTRSGSVVCEHSQDGGTTWLPVSTTAITPATPGTAEGFWVDVLVQGLRDFRARWVNGGTAQATWAVDQSLDTERPAAA